MSFDRFHRAWRPAFKRRRDIPAPEEARSRQLGQVLPMFAVMGVVVLGGAALITDVAWWWTSEQRMQRAADSAALAGAVYLPGDETGAFDAALDAAMKNGYTHGVGGVTVTPRRDPENERELIVDIDGSVQTNFARVFCWDGGPCLQSVAVGVTGAAEFILPVPMGSPENYYGVFGMTRGLTSTAVVTENHTDTARSCGSTDAWDPASGCTARVPTATAGSIVWQSSSTSGGNNLGNSLQNNNDVYGRTDTDGNGDQQRWRGFSAQTGIPSPGAGETVTIVGIQARLSDAWIDTACSGTGSPSASIGVQLSWNSGTSWSSLVRVPATGNLGTNPSNGDYVVGSATSTTAWGAHAWTRAELANLQVRLTANETCTGAKQFSVDMVDVRITASHAYTTSSVQQSNLADTLLKGPGSACTTGKTDCYEADGSALNPRGFWATLNTQGAENINGDAYQTGYDTRTGGVSPACPQNGRACYDGTTFYNYAIEMPPGATNGRVYVYDPQFCDVNEQKGTGDRWFGGDTAVSTFYTLYDTGPSLYDLAEDVQVAASGDRFRSMDWADSTMNGSGGAECLYRGDILYGDGRDWHNRWFLLNPSNLMAGGTEGKLYRIHTSSTDPANAGQQLGTNGENSFAIYVSATVPGGGSPRVYGLGAMQAYTPLTSNSSVDTDWADDVISEFYLAQIDAAHAGKTIEVRLWDPGDTQSLRAELQILRPDGGSWVDSQFTYTAAQGTTNSNHANCNSLSSTGTNSVLTNNGGGSGGGIYNGCWLTMRAPVPSDYDADQQGWWKIRYRMDGTGTSFDVTTWQVQLIGNPVHLVPE